VSKSMCRHCGRREVSRPRGLCWVDYYAPGVRDLYPPFDERLSSARPHAENVKGTGTRRRVSSNLGITWQFIFPVVGLKDHLICEVMGPRTNLIQNIFR
jgi:hypothetical protein